MIVSSEHKDKIKSTKYEYRSQSDPKILLRVLEKVVSISIFIELASRGAPG